ncbi:DUF6249 domain-containing protein [Leeuwenhoekiella sp. A16]|uniref:DUF6249 domain-containing protein n=1 Tax=Leeuwenhoekiella sp. A16 TaxID=3141462 RepID=UPI003A80A174|tara:strand:+ start:138524 stop:138871 length:348 start_codon:yes stop_codon:yes gene_type:complete
MGGEVIVFVSFFLVTFGIFYLHYTTRNKERLALIEKGADATIFGRYQNKEAPPVWKVIILNLGLLMIGIGIGILLAASLVSLFNLDEQVAYPATLFLMGGIALVVGFFLTKKLIN